MVFQEPMTAMSPVRTVGMQAIEAAVLLSALLLVPATMVGLFADYMQTGPILAVGSTLMIAGDIEHDPAENGGKSNYDDY